MEAIQTEKAPAAIGPYSQAIRADDFVFVSGQIPIDPQTGELVSGGFQEQARQSLENLKQILIASGTGLESVVAVDVFVTDISCFAAFNKVYEEYFSAHKPARAVVEVKGLPRGAMVEVKCVAVAPSS
ncbi:MAG TPA: RidA family protein [Syntrophobacteraceae bacterium]|nr:RidA family protein [Syntrophobacteraceae bacterium]